MRTSKLLGLLVQLSSKQIAGVLPLHVRIVQLHVRIVRHCTALYGTVRHCTALYGTVRHCTALYGTVRHCTALYGTVRHCTHAHLCQWNIYYFLLQKLALLQLTGARPIYRVLGIRV